MLNESIVYMLVYMSSVLFFSLIPLFILDFSSGGQHPQGRYYMFALEDAGNRCAGLILELFGTLTPGCLHHLISCIVMLGVGSTGR